MSEDHTLLQQRDNRSLLDLRKPPYDRSPISTTLWVYVINTLEHDHDQA